MTRQEIYKSVATKSTKLMLELLDEAGFDVDEISIEVKITNESFDEYFGYTV